MKATTKAAGTSPLRIAAPGIVLLLLALYLGLSLAGISRPGIEHDEGKFLAGSLDIRDFGHLHVMTFEYVGALKEYLWLPWVVLFEPSTLVLRVPAVGLGLLTLLLFHRLAAHLLPARFALACLALLALDPGFVFETRYDTGPVALAFFFRIAMLLCFVRFAREGRARDFLLGCLTLGLGIYNKLTFLVFALPLAVGCAVALPHTLALLARRRGLVLTGAFCVLLPLAPLLWFTLEIPGVTLRELSSRSAEFRDRQAPSAAGRAVAKLALIDGGLTGMNLLGDIRSGGRVFDDAYFASFRMGPESLDEEENPGLLGALRRFSTLHALLLAALAMVAVAPRRALPGTRVLAIAGMLQYGAILVLPGAVFSHHVLMLVPIAQLLVARVLWQWMSGLRRAGMRRAVAALVAVHLALCLARDVHFVSSVAAHGGRGWWSEATEDLVAHVEHRPGSCFVVMDWGIFPALQILSDNRVRLPEDLLWLVNEGEQLSARSRTRVRRQLARRAVGGRCHLLLHAPAYTRLPKVRERLDSLILERLGVDVIPDADGEPLFEVVEARIGPLASREGRARHGGDAPSP
jgi:hypothetical protein